MSSVSESEWESETTMGLWSCLLGSVEHRTVVRCGGTERLMWRAVGMQDCVINGLDSWPVSASASASSLPTILTCDGTLIHCISRSGLSSSTRSCVQSSTLLRGPLEPTQLFSSHFLAFPVAPRKTREELVQIAIFPEGNSFIA